MSAHDSLVADGDRIGRVADSDMPCDKNPPAETTFQWCPICGRSDRFASFGAKHHYYRGVRCGGRPVVLVYGLKTVLRLENEAT